MSLIFAATIPNSPELTEELLTAYDKPQSKTVAALQELEGECYFMKPDTVILLSEHDCVIDELISANIETTLESAWYDSMQNPGDLNHVFHTDIEFVTRIKEEADVSETDVPFTIHAQRKLSPEISTPLLFMTRHMPGVQVITMSTSCKMTMQQHYEFGQFLHHEIQKTNKRIAVFATGHLATTIQKPAARGLALDVLVQTALREQDPRRVLKINPDVATQSNSDVLHPFAALLGVVDKTNIRCELLSYEQLHGHGQAVINFVLQ